MKDFIKKIKLFILPKNKYINYLRKEGAIIGEKCDIEKDVNFGSEPYLIKIGNHVRITSGCKLITHDGGVWIFRNNEESKNIDLFGKINIGNNVHIGMNSIIMPNVNVGNNVIIGCGAVVTKNIPDNSIAVGVPAKIIENVDEYYQKNKDRFYNTKNLKPNDKKEYLKANFLIKN